MANFIQNVQAGPYAGDQQEIVRKQKLAQMLQAQSMEPIQAPQGGAFASPISPLQVLAKGLQAYKGKEAETQAKTQSEELSKRQQRERQAALTAALRQGMGAEQPPAEMGGGPAMPANPAAGMAQLAQSGDPSVMQMGMPPLQAMQAQQRQQQEQQFRASESAEARAAREQQAQQQRTFQAQQAEAARRQQEEMARLTASLKPAPVAPAPIPKAPTGYRYSAADPTQLEPIPGGPKDTSAKDDARAAGAVQKADTVIAKVDEALKDVNFLTTGLPGTVLGAIPGTSAYNLDKTIDTLKANLGFGELQAMREASPTGGALGQVAVQELMMLQSTVASLDKGQSKDSLTRALHQVRTHFENWKRVVQESRGGAPKPQQTLTTGGRLSAQEQQELQQLRQRFGR